MGLGPFSGAGPGSVRPQHEEVGEAMVEEPQEAQEAKSISAPNRPTPDQSHNISHIPFRSWCPHCVRGRGRSHQHKRVPVLVARDRLSKAVFTHLVPSKGVEHYYPEAALIRDIKFLGYTELTLKSDQEPSILALGNAVKNTLSSMNIECTLEASPKGDAHGMSNGEAESAVGITQGLARTLKDYVEHHIGQLIDPK